MKIFQIIFIPLLIFLNLHLNSQNTTFEYLLSTPLDEQFHEIVETDDGTIYYSGLLSNIEYPYHKNALIAQLDVNGNLMDSIVLTEADKSIFVYRLHITDSNGFVVVASIFDTTGWQTQSAILLYNMDENLNLSNETIHYFDSTYSLIDIYSYLEPNGDILTNIPLHIPPQVERSYIYKFNSSFDSIRAKYYPDESRTIISFKLLPNGNYWALNTNLRQYELLDTAFNIVSTQRIPDYLRGNQSVAWDTDSSFYLVGENLYPPPSHNLGFIKQFHPLDTTGHLYNHWRISDTVDYPAFWGGIDFKNKDSIFIGGTRNMWSSYYNPWPSWFIILQTDSLLNIRWERFYGGDAYYMMGKIVATYDGGCLVAGTRYDYLNLTEQETDIIILKLNSEGLITNRHDNPVIDMQEAIVYPNPGNEVINVRIAAQHKESVFELLDMNGRHILKQNLTGTHGIIKTTFLKHGTYIYKISNNNGLFENGKWVKQ